MHYISICAVLCALVVPLHVFIQLRVVYVSSLQWTERWQTKSDTRTHDSTHRLRAKRRRRRRKINRIYEWTQNKGSKLFLNWNVYARAALSLFRSNSCGCRALRSLDSLLVLLLTPISFCFIKSVNFYIKINYYHFEPCLCFSVYRLFFSRVVVIIIFVIVSFLSLSI